VCVVEIRQSFAGVGIGQEESPQPRRLGFCFGAVEQFELARMIGPAIRLLVVEPEQFLEDGFDKVANYGGAAADVRQSPRVAKPAGCMPSVDSGLTCFECVHRSATPETQAALARLPTALYDGPLSSALAAPRCGT